MQDAPPPPLPVNPPLGPPKNPMQMPSQGQQTQNATMQGLLTDFTQLDGSVESGDDMKSMGMALGTKMALLKFAASGAAAPSPESLLDFQTGLESYRRQQYKPQLAERSFWGTGMSLPPHLRSAVSSSSAPEVLGDAMGHGQDSTMLPRLSHIRDRMMVESANAAGAARPAAQSKGMFNGGFLGSILGALAGWKLHRRPMGAGIGAGVGATGGSMLGRHLGGSWSDAHFAPPAAAQQDITPQSAPEVLRALSNVKTSASIPGYGKQAACECEHKDKNPSLLPPDFESYHCSKCGKIGQVKSASTALVRRIMQGLLSQGSIQRAAQGMEPGAMRFVRNLGHGNMNVADHMVGNLGEGMAGQFVRKLPLRQLPADMAEQGGSALKNWYQPLVDHSKQFEQQFGNRIISPYVHAGERGAFQELDRAGSGGTARGLFDTASAKGRQAVRDAGPGIGHSDAHRLGSAPIQEAFSPMGLGDIHNQQFGPGGRLIDYSVLNGGAGGSRTPLSAASNANLDSPFLHGSGVTNLVPGNSLGEGHLDQVRRSWLNPGANPMENFDFPMANVLPSSGGSGFGSAPQMLHTGTTIGRNPAPLHAGNPGEMRPPVGGGLFRHMLPWAAGAGVAGGMGAGMAKASDDLGGDPRMRGWQWKALQKSETEGQQQWMPRVFTSQATPLTELLASPAKQGILKGLLGAAVGGGAGYLAGGAGGMSTGATTAIGAGLGGLAGAVHGYGHRREKNDEVNDALRRLPPGAVVRDFNHLKAEDAKTAAQKPDGSYQTARSATGESKGLSMLCDEEAHTTGMKAWKSVESRLRIAPKLKTQPDPRKGDHQGKEAYDRMTPTAQGFFKRCEALGITDLGRAVKQAADFAPEAEAELRDGLEKLADLKGWMTAGQGLWNAGKSMFRGAAKAAPGVANAAEHAAPGVANAAEHAAPAAMPWIRRTFFGGAGTAPNVVEHAAPEAANWMGQASNWAGHAGHAGNVALGGMGGYMEGQNAYDRMAGVDPEHPENVGWGRTAAGFAGAGLGAATMTNRGRNMMLGRGPNTAPGRNAAFGLPFHMLEGRLLGGGAGFGMDMASGLAGVTHEDQYGRQQMGMGLGEAGANLGTIFGGVRGMGSAMRGASRLGGAPTPGGTGWRETLGGAGRGIERFGMRAGEAATQPAGVLRDWAAGRPLGFARTVGGLGASAFMGPQILNSISGTLANRAMPAIASQAGPMVDGAMDMADNRLMQRLSSLGMLNQRGQFSMGNAVTNSFGQMMNPAMQHIDQMFHSMGMDPSQMSMPQKLALLGGGAMGAGGAMMGSPAMMAGGGASAMAGLLPLLMHGNNNRPQPGGPSPSGSGQPGQSPQGQPGYRNEWDVQRRLNGA